ncbi:MAG: FtsX-like permease family protein [Spirosomataceae bacterium]
MTFNIISDGQLMLFIPFLVIVVTFLAGFYPGLILAGFQPVLALKGKLSQQNIGGFNTRRVLIITQFAISQVLIIGMIVIAKQINYSKQSDLGFDREAIVLLPQPSSLQVAKTLKNQLLQIAGVENVALCFAAPASGSSWNTTPRYNNNIEEEVFRVSVKAGDEDYLKTFGLKLLAGRNLFPADTVKEFLVNETFAKKLNLASPLELLGKNLKINGNMSGPIVGIIKDFHDQSFHQDISPVCVFTSPDLYSTYGVKINLGNVATTMAAIEKTWGKMNPDQVYHYEFLDDHIALFYETEALMLKLIQAFSLIAIFIGCLGLYGLVSFMASQKTKEIGIRKVLGSTVGQILWIFGKEFVRLISVAFILAAPIAWWLMNTWLQDFKFPIEIDAWVFGLTILITLAVATLTIVHQSLKAALVNPVKSLKSE